MYTFNNYTDHRSDRHLHKFNDDHIHHFSENHIHNLIDNHIYNFSDNHTYNVNDNNNTYTRNLSDNNPKLSDHSSRQTMTMKVVKMVTKKVVGGARRFCLTTTMHGFSHIASPKRHWLERILWIAIVMAAIWGTLDISLGQLQRYNENPTVVTLEKDFRTWRFPIPAVTACYQNRVDPTKLSGVIRDLWNVGFDDEMYDYYSRFVSMVANSDLFHLEDYEEFIEDPTLDAVDLAKLILDVSQKTLEIRTTWSEVVNPLWTKVLTESGVCFTTNSLAIADVALEVPDMNDTKTFPVACKYASMSCYVMFEFGVNMTFYMHSNYDVMDMLEQSSRCFLSLNRVTTVSVMESHCGPGVKDLTPRRRKCFYTDEPAAVGRKVYSTNTCRLSCRNRVAIKLCGCKPFYFMYDEGVPCTPKGMFCLSKHSNALANMKDVECTCGQQCVDAVFRELSIEDQLWGKGPFLTRGSARYVIQAPRTRYTREIVFHFQDLVVSFGGAAGLFLGASFISFVEIFYFNVEGILGICVKCKPKENVKIKSSKPTISYETVRILELTKIIKNQKLFDQKLFQRRY